MEKPLKSRLVDYMRRSHTQWFPSITLQKLTMDKAGQTGKTCTRRLQEAVNEGLLEVKYIHGAAQYRALPERDLQKEFADYWASI